MKPSAIPPTTSTTTTTAVVNKENEYQITKKDEFNTFTKDQTFYYCVMPGNYPATMRNIMTRRLNWVEVSFCQK
jgi:hypothetical protein